MIFEERVEKPSSLEVSCKAVTEILLDLIFDKREGEDDSY